MAEVVETETFAKWLKGLRDRIARRNILRRIARIASTDNFGDHASVGGGVSELRVHFGPGYRLYYTIREEKIVLLLCGGDKKHAGPRHRKSEGNGCRAGMKASLVRGGTDKMVTRIQPFDAAHYLEGAADQADLLSDAVDSGDPRYIAYALGAVARARGGIAKLAREAGMNRQALHKALSEDGNPTLDTVLKVLRALGLHMRIEEMPDGGGLEAAE